MENNVIEPEQFDFRKGLSNTYQFYRFVEDVTIGLTRKQYTAAIFLGVEKAFCRVWIFGHVKLYHLSPPLIKLIYSYLKDRNFHIKIKDSVSQPFFAHCGIPKGPKLSPKLFNLFINGVPHHLHTNLAILGFYCVCFSTPHFNNLPTWMKYLKPYLS